MCFYYIGGVFNKKGKRLTRVCTLSQNLNAQYEGGTLQNKLDYGAAW